MSGGAQNTFLVQEVMEEEWNALRSVESRPEALAQVRLGYVFVAPRMPVSSLCLFPQVL